MTDEELRASFARDVVLLRAIGVRPVVVHGGGPQIESLLRRLGKQSSFVDGRRVTDDDTMEVVEMVLGGRLNREIVELLNRAGGRSIGLTGNDGSMLQVRRRVVDGRDLGRVGEVVAVDAGPIRAVSDAGYVPVVAPIGVDAAGLTYNVNADEAAGAIARALGAEKLILLTDVEGVKDASGRLISRLTREEVRKLHERGHDPGRHDPEGGVLPRRAGGRRRPHAHHRRAHPPRDPARDLHRRRRRHADHALRCPRTSSTSTTGPPRSCSRSSRAPGS